MCLKRHAQLPIKLPKEWPNLWVCHALNKILPQLRQALATKAQTRMKVKRYSNHLDQMVWLSPWACHALNKYLPLPALLIKAPIAMGIRTYLRLLDELPIKILVHHTKVPW